MSKTVLIPLADGFEEIEAMTMIDVLRRAGADLTVCSLAEEKTVTGAHGVRVIADEPLSMVENCTFDLVALPGGMPGASNLRASEALTKILAAQNAHQGLIGAICAAPAVVLNEIGLLEGKMATAYPGFIDTIPEDRRSTDTVVEDGHIVTSAGPGTAIEFALRLTTRLFGPAKAAEVSAGMLVVQ
ncbi:DJ-1 family glyoxalase III [Desulfovibrio inopinatus]|uniref:DJ-1 family glyoxalase III n=1 Tax=Desulfovibrio inopinatus TaxID=102109 RepID=UPI0003F853E5|nr:DJ-1 family glyoxalase III [Desulfovibrio inopinatus]